LDERLKADSTYKARRIAVQSLIDIGMDRAQAEHWCDAWEAAATRKGVVQDPYYWDAGRGWIDAQRATRRISTR
jgi:hypothetical protein